MIHNKDLAKKSAQTPKKLTSEITSGSEKVEFVRPSDEPKSSGHNKDASPHQEQQEPEQHPENNQEENSVVMKLDDTFDFDSSNFQVEQEEGLEEKFQRFRVATCRQVRGGSFDPSNNYFPVRTLSIISEAKYYQEYSYKN